MNFLTLPKAAALVTLSMVKELDSEVWEALATLMETEKPEIGPRDWSPRTGKCLCRKGCSKG